MSSITILRGSCGRFLVLTASALDLEHAPHYDGCFSVANKRDIILDPSLASGDAKHPSTALISRMQEWTAGFYAALKAHCSI